MSSFSWQPQISIAFSPFNLSISTLSLMKGYGMLINLTQFCRMSHCCRIFSLKLGVKWLWWKASSLGHPYDICGPGCGDLPELRLSPNQVWSLSNFNVSCQVLRKTLIKPRPCSWLPQRPSPTKSFLSWLGPLRWHRPSLSFAETTNEPGCSQAKVL